MSSPAESVKENSRHLRGSIVEELILERPDFTKETVQILKFHGTYQQTDRDLRKAGKPAEYGSMVRVGVPGGALTADQYLELDRLADAVGDGGLRITTRQDIQFHRVRKTDLRTLLRALNANLLTTLAACGDVVRNVVACPAPFGDAERVRMQQLAQALGKELKPSTRAYYEIWLDGEKAAAAESAAPEEELLYGSTYLPRKFKIGFAPPGDNCIDVYSNDVGIVPGPDGFTLLVGGGFGMSPGVKATHPRLAEPLGSVAPEHLNAALKTVIAIHRDYGNRTNRKLARLKYVIEEWGIERFRAEFESRLGAPVAPAQPLEWASGSDHLGWHNQAAGSFFVGVPIPSGRVRDDLRAGLREVIERFRPGVSLTAQQNLFLTNIAAQQRADITRILAQHGIRAAEELPPVVRESIGCVALPTCGLAITEAERVMPEILDGIHGVMADLGIGSQPISVRVTGCPNGCARPYSAEIGLVGQSVDMYAIYLGASHLGIRLGSVFAENVKRHDIANRLRPVLESYARERGPNEAFGDYCERVGLEALHAQEVQAV
ncbi:MAG TPA: NADPH-dependent assimilatory sulfite reductase hemoprotein subunit [Bryobacteraceae bacterium]|nr:NADPH-dependent assimilatory sulfite reductase hemoprotein subunit [Bryobacteraceae bacterium]